MPEKAKHISQTGEMPRVDPSELQSLRRDQPDKKLPDMQQSEDAATGIMKIVIRGENEDETTAGDDDAPTGK